MSFDPWHYRAGGTTGLFGLALDERTSQTSLFISESLNVALISVV